MATGDISESDLLQNLEAQELEAPGGIASCAVYGKLLCIYLLRNDLINAKFLWKRIPASVKTTNPELGNVWTVGQHLWNRDFTGVYKSVDAAEWSPEAAPVMQKLKDATRQRALALVSQAYSSIDSEEFAAMVGLSVNDAAELAVSQGWTADPNTRMIVPVRTEKGKSESVSSEKQLSRLTDFVSFLET